MPGAPCGECGEGRPQRRSIRAESIFCVCSRIGEDAAFDDAGALELAQLLGQDFLRGARKLAAQFIEAMRPLLERP